MHSTPRDCKRLLPGWVIIFDQREGKGVSSEIPQVLANAVFRGSIGSFDVRHFDDLAYHLIFCYKKDFPIEVQGHFANLVNISDGRLFADLIRELTHGKIARHNAFRMK